MAETNTPAFSVYYDQSCPLCRQEIAFYRRRVGAHAIDWIDVSQPHNAPTEISCQQAMARFHVRTQAGELVDGGRAFVLLWQQLPAFQWLGRIFDTPITGWSVRLAYNLFLPLRPRLQTLFRGPDHAVDQNGNRK